MATGRGFNQHVISTSVYHSHVHAGIMFSVDVFDLALAGGGTLGILFVTPATPPIHILYDGELGGDAKLELFEDVTVSANGTLLAPINRNRNSAFTDGVTAYQDPTVTDFGLTLDTLVVPGGSGGAAQGGGAAITLDWELKVSSQNLLLLTNLTGQNHIAHLHTDYYYEFHGTTV